MQPWGSWQSLMLVHNEQLQRHIEQQRILAELKHERRSLVALMVNGMGRFFVVLGHRLERIGTPQHITT
jgi:hypothetical protein